MAFKSVFDIPYHDHEGRKRRERKFKFWMSQAVLQGSISKDSTKVGAILVDNEGHTLLSAYNGPPRGVNDTPDRFERPKKYLYAAHAEQNIIATAARVGLKTAGLNMFVTHHPCCDCAKSIIQSGIARVIVDDGTTSMPAESFQAAREMFKEAGVKVETLYSIKGLTATMTIVDDIGPQTQEDNKRIDNV